MIKAPLSFALLMVCSAVQAAAAQPADFNFLNARTLLCTDADEKRRFLFYFGEGQGFEAQQMFGEYTFGPLTLTKLTDDKMIVQRVESITSIDAGFTYTTSINRRSLAFVHKISEWYGSGSAYTETVLTFQGTCEIDEAPETLKEVEDIFSRKAF